jgi:sulfate permease, SulP family
LLLPGATIALISFADEIVTARSFAAKNRYQIDADQELVGLGVADVACGLVGGFPVSSSSARTAVVDVMGGKTQVVGLVASAFLILFLFFFTGLLAHLPLVVLATVLIVAVSGLVDVAEFRRLYTIRRSEFILAIVTMFAVLTLGLLEALGIAITLALVAALSRLVRPNDAVLVPNASGEGFHEIELRQTRDHAMVSGVIVYRFDGPLFFANAPRFLQRVRTLVAASDPAPEWLLIDAEAIVDLDTTAASMLSDLVEELRGRGIQVGVARASAPLRRMFQKTGLMEQIGSDCLFPMVSAAVRDCSASRQVTRQDGEALRVQTAVSHGTGIA